MPHKHVRRKDDDKSNFNLAPTTIAKPLVAYKTSSQSNKKPSKTLKRKRDVDENGYKHDDTPRAFARMMQLQTGKKRQRSGLDDDAGSRKAKKRRSQKDEQEVEVAPRTVNTSAAQSEKPKILPGERLGDFAARVDQALPVGGLRRKGNVKVDGLKEGQTKTEKRMQKMYASWREEEARRKEKVEEEQELEEEAEDERDAAMGGQGVQLQSSGKKRKKMIGEDPGGDDDDPWAALAAKRDRPRGLHDVVQAPPNIKTVPREKFKVRRGARVDVADIPAAAGSLRRREELSEARREVLERYRAMMKRVG